MKKLLCLCLAAGMLLSVCACHRTETGTADPPPAVSETTPPAEGDGQAADDTTPRNRPRTNQRARPAAERRRAGRGKVRGARQLRRAGVRLGAL